ncbi:MAG: TVP38/TMEM64 family protein [Gammaproteobacteria bacterium]|nr:TVP38/TMEM64 family protein [Gammaproteobacteria bacterium]
MKRGVALALIVLALGALVLALRWLPLTEWLGLAIAWIEEHRASAWIVFIFTYITATVMLLPAFVLTLAAGFVFGLPFGVALVSAGSTLGACGAFLIGRYFARGWVEKRIENHSGFRALDLATHHEGFVIVFLVRLSPVFPFNLINYGLSLTAVRFRDYAIATWIGMLPVTVLYVYIGTAASDLSQLVGGELDAGWAGRVSLFAGLAATVVLIAFITRKATRVLGQHLERELHDEAESQ